MGIGAYGTSRIELERLAFGFSLRSLWSVVAEVRHTCV